jgi:hypothetical protein
MANSGDVWVLVGLGAAVLAIMVVIGRRLMRTYVQRQKTHRLEQRFADRLKRRSD